MSMKRYIVGLCCLLSVLFFALVEEVSADWPYYTVLELAERADIIVLGTVEGELSKQRENGLWYTYWGVEVDYYLKEDGHKYEKIVIRTPGASLRMSQSSIDYALDYRGKHVLLFLSSREDGSLTPLTPTAVIGRSGESFQSTHVPSAERDDLRALLAESMYIEPESGLLSPLYQQEKMFLNKLFSIGWWGYGLLALLLVLVVYWRRRRRKNI